MRCWYRFPAALWWGSLSTLGFFVVPMLFGHLPNKPLAGNMAARLFEMQTWVSVTCGLVLLLALQFHLRQQRKSSDTVDSSDKHVANQAATWFFSSHNAFLFIVLGMLLALLIQFGIAPRIVARENLILWHSLGSVMYFAQWVCAGVVLWKV